jgi:hypothetical protein
MLWLVLEESMRIDRLTAAQRASSHARILPSL